MNIVQDGISTEDNEYPPEPIKLSVATPRD